jgi:hypothetical protein
MDPRPGPVPYFHELFNSVRDPLHEQFAAPGVIKVSSNVPLVGDDEKKSGLKVEYVHDLDTKETNVTGQIKLRCPSDKNFYGGWTLSNNSGCPFNPVVQCVCPTVPHSLTVDREKAVFHYAHNTFAVRAQTKFWEGGVPVYFTGVACLSATAFAGVLIDYDAFRSGLRRSLLSVNYGRGTDRELTASVNGRFDFGFSVNQKVAKYTSLLVDVFPAENIAVAGVQFQAPCGHGGLLRYDFLARQFSVALKWPFKQPGWTVGVSASFDEEVFVKKASYVPKFGFTFSL